MNNNELYHYGVLGMKWGIHRANVNAAKAKRAKARGKYEQAKKYSDKSKKILKKHTDRTSKETVKYVNKTSTGKLVAESLLLGTYGALKYNQARASKNASRGRAAVEGILYSGANRLSYGLLGIVEPRLRASDKNKRK